VIEEQAMLKSSTTGPKTALLAFVVSGLFALPGSGQDADGVFVDFAGMDATRVESSLAEILKSNVTLSANDVANLEALVADLAGAAQKPNDVVNLVSYAALATGDPIGFLQRAASTWPADVQERIWGTRPYVVLEDFEPGLKTRLFELNNMQKRPVQTFDVTDAAAFRGEHGAHLAVGESVRSGISSFGVRLPSIPIPNDPFGLRLHFKNAAPANVHLIVGYVLPDENMSYEYRHTVAIEAADGWNAIDSGLDFFLAKKRVVESFYEKYLNFLAKLERGTTWKEIPLELHYVALDIPEGDANSYWFDSLEVYLPSAEEAPAVPADPGPLGAATRGFTSRRTFDRSAGPSSEEQELIAELNAIGYVGGEVEASGESSVTIYDEDRTYDGLNLYVTGDSPAAYLMNMRGEVLHTWRFKYDAEIFPHPEASYHHWRRAALGEDGALFAIVEGLAIMKINNDSNIIWANPGNYHHDLQPMDDGTLYTLTRTAHIVPRWNTKDPILEDFITVLDADGKELRSVSLLECMEYSDYAPLLTGIRSAGDVFHTNTLEVLDGRLADRSPAFKKGNVLISMNHLDFIGIVDMDKEKFVWGQTGMWQRQHQPTVLDNGNMLIFDNIGPMALKGSIEASRVMEFDSFTREVVWRFEGTRDRYFHSQTSGSCERLPNGNTLISETDNGRALEVAPDGTVVWEFWNPARMGENDTLIAKIFELTRIDPDIDLSWLQE
jgi:hypothetical protein